MARAAQHFEELVSCLGLEETLLELLACFIWVVFGPALSSTSLVRKGLQAASQAMPLSFRRGGILSGRRVSVPLHLLYFLPFFLVMDLL